MNPRQRHPLIGTDWDQLLEQELAEEYWADLQDYVARERSRNNVYPPAEKVFAALRLTLCAKTKLVIVGQDPYCRAGQANGLSFSVGRNVDLPPSLRNIYQELHDDLNVPIPSHGNLEGWARQGVLLLNTTLTVREGKPGSHRGQGWERFTNAVVRIVAEKSEPVFLLWGKDAQGKLELIKGFPLAIIASPHPSPLSARRGFFGSKPFSRANQALIASGRKAIDWRLTK